MNAVIQRMDARVQRDAKRSLRSPQEQYLFDRKDRLKQIQKAELLKDETLLESIEKSRSSAAWFISQDVDSNTGGILEKLSSFFSDDSSASKYIRGIVDEFAGDDNFIKDRYYEELGNPLYKYVLEPKDPGSLTHFIGWLIELVEENHCSPPDAPDVNDRAVGMLRDGLEVLNTVHLLLRFVDERNAKAEEYPNSDGSNLHEDDLKTSWLLHRAWIRTLHLRSLEMGSEKFGWDHLQQIIKLGIALHIVELQRVPMNRKSDRQTPALYGDILQTMHNEYYTALSNFAKDLHIERRTNQNFTLGETLAYNLRPARFNAILTQASDESSMLAYLIGRYNRLEYSMDQEHVEDVLMNKRIVIKDENFSTFDVVGQEHYTHKTIHNLPEKNRQFDYEDRVRKISQINRKRRNYLLLRDWSKKRPWKQIYEQQDVADKPGWRRAIRDFHSRIDVLKEMERGEKPSPSSPANVWSSLFPIHPIASHDDDIEGQGPFRPPHFDGGCIICFDSFALDSNALIVRLHCDHIFHFSCIRDHWDHEDHYQTRCPTCRSGSNLGGWYLHEVAGIYPEALDLFDNRIIAHDAVANRVRYRTDPTWRANHTETEQLIMTDPDLGALFKNKSYGQYDQSVHWNGGKRDPEIEMIQYRRRRRCWNQRNREVVRIWGENMTSRFGPPPEVVDQWTGPTAEQILEQQRIATNLATQRAAAAAADAEAVRVAAGAAGGAGGPPRAMSFAEMIMAGAGVGGGGGGGNVNGEGDVDMG